MPKKREKRFPALPLFVDDFEAATVHLSLAEDGAYNRLMRLIWRSSLCSVPNDPDWIRRRMRASQDEYDSVIEPVIAEFFYVKKDRLFQKRLLKEREFISKKIIAGKKGGDANALNYKDQNGVSASSLLGSERERIGKPQPNPTQLESGTENIITDIPAPAPPRGGSGKYAFEGRIIRLNQKDFDKWVEVYRNIPDLRSELAALDDWCAANWDEKQIKKWFPAVSAMLRNKHQELPTKKPTAVSQDPDDPDNKWRNRLRFWIDHQAAADNWFEDDGPRPDEAGHNVPSHIMKEFDLADPNIGP